MVIRAPFIPLQTTLVLCPVMVGAFISDLQPSCQKLKKASVKLMWIYLSKTFEIYKGSQFWPPFLIRVCSCTQGSQLPSLPGGQAFVLWPRFENPSRALWRAEPVDVWKAVPGVFYRDSSIIWLHQGGLVWHWEHKPPATTALQHIHVWVWLQGIQMCPDIKNWNAGVSVAVSSLISLALKLLSCVGVWMLCFCCLF